MIKSLNLPEPDTNLPSKSQLKRLTVGDRVRLVYNDEDFEVNLVYARENEMLGVVKKIPGCVLPDGLMEEDLVSFETKHICQVIPDRDRMKLPPFMLLTHHDNQDVFVLHTAHPRLIGWIQFGDRVDAKEAVWIDERWENEKERAALLRQMTEWYFYNYLINKK